MEKNLSALGFMSGTSGDGVDTSVISSNGKDTINIKYNRFDPYPTCLLYTSPSPRDHQPSRMPSSA